MLGNLLDFSDWVQTRYHLKKLIHQKEITMPAYLIVRVNVTDMDQYQEYMKLTPSILEKYGGKFIVRGGEKVVLEGPDITDRMVMVKFDSVEAAKKMYNSDEYQAAIKVRENAAEASFIVMEGLE